MLFVGRQSEKKIIMEALNCGRNIILGGKFGIGRTRLIREIAKLVNKRRFIFVDFGQTPGKMSEKVMKALGIPRRFKNQTQQMGYKSMRYRIANVTLTKEDKTVIVLDNIAKITAAKKLFLRYLVLEQRFQFVAIVESVLPPGDLAHLKAHLWPVDILSLRNLKTSDVISLMRIYSQKHHLNWSDKHIHDLSGIINGYP